MKNPMDLYDVRITGSKVFLRLLDIGDAESLLQYPSLR